MPLNILPVFDTNDISLSNKVTIGTLAFRVYPDIPGRMPT